jgi:hypothetical protein
VTRALEPSVVPLISNAFAATPVDVPTLEPSGQLPGVALATPPRSQSASAQSFGSRTTLSGVYGIESVL